MLKHCVLRCSAREDNFMPTQDICHLLCAAKMCAQTRVPNTLTFLTLGSLFQRLADRSETSTTTSACSTSATASATTSASGGRANLIGPIQLLALQLQVHPNSHTAFQEHPFSGYALVPSCCKQDHNFTAQDSEYQCQFWSCVQEYGSGLPEPHTLPHPLS